MYLYLRFQKLFYSNFTTFIWSLAAVMLKWSGHGSLYPNFRLHLGFIFMINNSLFSAIIQKSYFFFVKIGWGVRLTSGLNYRNMSSLPNSIDIISQNDYVIKLYRTTWTIRIHCMTNFIKKTTHTHTNNNSLTFISFRRRTLLTLKCAVGPSGRWQRTKPSVIL